MLKLKLQYLGHLMRRANSLEKTLMLGRIEGGVRRGRRRARWLDGVIDSMIMSLSKLREMVKDREAWCPLSQGWVLGWGWAWEGRLPGSLHPYDHRVPVITPSFTHADAQDLRLSPCTAPLVSRLTPTQKASLALPPTEVPRAEGQSCVSEQGQEMAARQLQLGGKPALGWKTRSLPGTQLDRPPATETP